jgi:hypothetical protein
MTQERFGIKAFFGNFAGIKGDPIYSVRVTDLFLFNRCTFQSLHFSDDDPAAASTAAAVAAAAAAACPVLMMTRRHTNHSPR